MQNIKEYRYLTPFEVLVIHVLLVNWEPDTDYDPFESTPKSNLLVSAVRLCEQPYYNSIHMKAAALFRSINKNHAFGDGNKRTATISLIVFLLLNGYDLIVSDKELIKFALRVARGDDNLYRIKSWIKRRLRKIHGIESIGEGRRNLFSAFSNIMKFYEKR